MSPERGHYKMLFKEIKDYELWRLEFYLIVMESQEFLTPFQHKASLHMLNCYYAKVIGEVDKKVKRAKKT